MRGGGVFWLARPIPGLGIALPVFVPATATVIVALLVSAASRSSPMWPAVLGR
jgi:uncharacterized membrane protein